MTNNVMETVGQELEKIDREYSADFAGHSRLTRDVGQMDRMVKDTAAILERLDRVPVAAQGPELSRMREAAAKSLELYKAELQAIVRAQAVGPAFEQFASEATNANLVFARYMRHFAGKDRSTRDVALLGEIVEDLRQIDKRMTALLAEDGNREFERDRQVVRQNLVQYQQEIEQISTAQTSRTPDIQASLLAGLANEQFAVYQAHFAGEPRISRRPTLLARVITALKKIHERMVALREGGISAEFNGNNIGIVEDRLRVYENELAEIRKLRQATPMTDIMGELGSAANKLFDEYRANFADKPRNAADVKRLANICDKLGEILRQMVEMSWAEESEMNQKNLAVVTEQLGMFESEYEAVVRAQSSSTR